MIRRIVPILFIFVILSHYNITTAQISKLRGVNIVKIDVLSPFGRILRASISTNIGFGFGGLIGYQALIHRRVTVSGFIGPTYNGLAAYESWEIWAGINVGLVL
ncbi:MAG: hypothetical protein ISS19_07210 [Bacteroidales bacterium]|nr:hypothetical protein [Bacteroidales bacterium]